MFSLAGGLYLGWALGANDAANVFGTAVASRIIALRRATMLCATAALIGAALEGGAGIETLSGLTSYTQRALLIVTLSAAITVSLMTTMSLPISTSQAVVGAITGIGLATEQMNWGGLAKVVICWLATPVGAMVAAVVIYYVLGLVLRRIPMSILTRDKLLWGGLVAVGVYGSYALGANNVANVTGVFSGHLAGLSDRKLAILGGAAIGLGVMTFSKRVMMSVGKGVMSLDAFSALVAVSSMAVTVHVFAWVGVPVSTSQAIVGALVGMGFIRGAQVLHLRVLRNIAAGWVLTPAVALVLSAAAHAIVA
ncbi:MAG: anion permease [Phycisphaerae bacterium]|jgi:PiT family inorganic phosphate transporter|nr:anion permease [Phycisphaerae bacterium]